MRELLTATRMNTLLACPRRHYWRFEVGLQQERSADALRFGSAWHRAMEERAKGATIEVAFQAAILGKTDLDELQVATLSGMLAGYYAKYQVPGNVAVTDPLVGHINPEVPFQFPLAGSRTFDVAGRIDGLAVLRDGRMAMMEYKTAGNDIGPDSEYWLRLRFNWQLFQYVLAARALGWNVATVVYDVARKPEIGPRQVPVLDPAGHKIVLDAAGNRVFKKDGSPRESADRDLGYVLQVQVETPTQFGDRLEADSLARPDFYFARREVPILEDDLREFEAQRIVLSRSILACRSEARRATKPEHGWPRNIGEFTCRNCEYCGFCLQNTSIDTAHPPTGFRVGPVNPELTNNTNGVAQ